MDALIIAVLGFLLGVLMFPLLLFLRARRSDSWDDSNMTNIYRVIAHLATHPEDFGKMWLLDTDGHAYKKPFWYIDKDELSDVVDSRAED